MKELEDRGYGATKSRCWVLLKNIVKKSGKFPPRLVFRIMAKGLYEKNKTGNAVNFTAPGTWGKITK